MKKLIFQLSALLALSLLLFTPMAALSQAPQKGNKTAPQKEEEGVLKLNTELVTVPFSITDKKNKYITDVKMEEINILEDGKPQEIFSFTKETDLPLTFAILFDTSGSQELTIPAQKEAALRFLEKVMRSDKDLAAVITFRRDIELVQTLTANVKQIRQSLDKIRFTGDPQVGTPPVGGSNAGTSLYDSIFVTADELLAGEAGRRVIILLTDGRDTTSSYNRQKAIERALRSEVIIYSIGIEGRGQYGGRVFSQDIDKKTLQTLCEETGGRLFVPQKADDYDTAFRQIEEDLRQQYIISYSPSNETLNGAFRNISVKINRKEAKELKVLHRRGYYAKKGA